MVSDSSSKYPSPKPTRIFSEVAGDVTISVNGESFLLHKFPLVSRCGKIRKMVSESNVSSLELVKFPGGPHTFELAMKFCYGINFKITTENVAGLRCAAEYLEMSDEYKEDNLITRTKTYMNEVVVKSLEKSVQVLSTCEMLLPCVVEEVGIPKRCVDAIAMNVCKEQLASGLSRLECDDSESTEFKNGSHEWWVEDLSVLKIEYFQRVIRCMGNMGVRPDSIVVSLMHYAQTSLKDIGKWNQERRDGDVVETDERIIVECVVSLMQTDKNFSIPLNFLFGMLRVAIVVNATLSCRLDLERRIGYRLELVLLDDLLIPSVRADDSLFDVDTVHRIVVNFLQNMEDEEEDDEEDCEYESPGHDSLLKVGRLIDVYLAEIAPDPYLSLQKFIAMIEILPDYARVMDDGLYRAIDVYLKAHTATLNEEECKKLCRFIDCGKLSQEACSHASQNDRLPVQMTVRVLYFEQIRLKDALSGSYGDGLLSQRTSSGVPSAAMSPRDNYASLRRENRELKLEISRMRVRLSELEKEQTFMKQEMVDKSGNGKTFFTSLSKGIGRIGIFSSPTGGKRQKSARKSRGSEGKTSRSKRHSAA